ncbi:integrin subunit alpha 9 [Turdus rufiventris]|nr:integrin subunit alpha 9 [Turdus rufiventris]
MPTARRCGARLLWTLLWVAVVRSYNVDVGRPVVFRGPNGSFFGYSVLQHYHDSTRWVLVGAPKAESKYSTSVQSPGAVFKCRVHTNPDRRCTELDMGRGNSRGMLCGKTCKEDRDDEWMGVSLARQPKAGGSVLACAHRWKNIYYETEYILPHGFCNIIPPDLQSKGKKLLPCYEAGSRLAGGISKLERDKAVDVLASFSVAVERPGPGSVACKARSTLASLPSWLCVVLPGVEYKKKYGEEHGSCQAGIAGFFTEVYIFRTDRQSGSLIKIFQASGKKMGSYFGSSLCAVDLNSDGLSDLLVGAPMFSEIRDEGQVTVYINRGNGVLEEQLTLDGDSTYNAHFGESMAALGDIDDDGFPDVAIGAPKEDNYIGAVYIYHGDANGIIPQYSMKLSGQTISPKLRMFGQSISGGVDMDSNGYPDMTVGAFLSDNVVLLREFPFEWSLNSISVLISRSRPVITVDVTIFLPVSINITAPQCHDGLQPVNCLNVTACFRFSGKNVPGEIDLNYNLTADVAKKEKSQQPRVYFVTSGEAAGQITEKLQLSFMQEKCEHYLAYVKGRNDQGISSGYTESKFQ